MTWIVVFGSTIVMMVWIVVYSFFFSSDFINEMEILFGGIQFWAAIVFSATVALGTCSGSVLGHVPDTFRF